jgi:hypothetical protein
LIGKAWPCRSSRSNNSLFAELLSSGHEKSQAINGNHRPTTGHCPNFTSGLRMVSLDGLFDAILDWLSEAVSQQAPKNGPRRKSANAWQR